MRNFYFTFPFSIYFSYCCVCIYFFLGVDLLDKTRESVVAFGKLKFDTFHKWKEMNIRVYASSWPHSVFRWYTWQSTYHLITCIYIRCTLDACARWHNLLFWHHLVSISEDLSNYLKINLKPNAYCRFSNKVFDLVSFLVEG